MPHSCRVQHVRTLIICTHMRIYASFSFSCKTCVKFTLRKFIKIKARFTQAPIRTLTLTTNLNPEHALYFSTFFFISISLSDFTLEYTSSIRLWLVLFDTVAVYQLISECHHTPRDRQLCNYNHNVTLFCSLHSSQVFLDAV